MSKTLHPILIFHTLFCFHLPGQHLEPYFSSHPERDAYVTLLQMTDPPAPDAVLKAALIQRACADVRRVMRLREDKPAVQALLQKGSVGDELSAALNAAEKEVEAEILEVMHEANSFLHGWGQFIFNTAGEMVQNEKTRKLMEEYPRMRAEAGEWYLFLIFCQSTLIPLTRTQIPHGEETNRGYASHKTRNKVRGTILTIHPSIGSPVIGIIPFAAALKPPTQCCNPAQREACTPKRRKRNRERGFDERRRWRAGLRNGKPKQAWQ